jgi:hypothetical protein
MVQHVWYTHQTSHYPVVHMSGSRLNQRLLYWEKSMSKLQSLPELFVKCKIEDLVEDHTYMDDFGHVVFRSWDNVEDFVHVLMKELGLIKNETV